MSPHHETVGKFPRSKRKGKVSGASNRQLRAISPSPVFDRLWYLFASSLDINQSFLDASFGVQVFDPVKAQVIHHGS